MPENVDKELDQKAFEVILKFKPNGTQNRKVVDEILKLKNDIKKAINYLTKEEQEIFEFRYFYGLDESEIARRLNIPVDQINKVLLKAATKIKKILADGFPGNVPQEPDLISIPGNATQNMTSMNKTVGLVMLLCYVVFLIVLIIGVYGVLQKFVFNEKPSLSQIFTKAGNSIQQQVDSSKVLKQITETKRYFDTGDPHTLRISGSTSLLPVARRWENAFNIEYPKYHVSLLASDSDVGVDSLIDGKIDIANSSRPLTFVDHNRAKQQGMELAEHRVAIDALIVAVNKNNPLESISLEGLKSIFNGKVSSWKTFGGSNAPIISITREKGSGTNNFVRNRVLGGDEFAASVRRINSNKDIIKAISDNVGAISCINSKNFNMDDKSIKYLKVKSYENSLAVPPFEGDQLNEIAIRYGDYPLAHYLYLVTLKEPPDKVKDFVNWISTPQGQKIVRYSGLIPVYED
ncbi:MAG: substrate-binding domain-containing protein [Candidatus Melainabacteria bacterium]|nr:substrate-binding domain-containing protein [Candidatus Melainabacteria bacterium]